MSTEEGSFNVRLEGSLWCGTDEVECSIDVYLISAFAKRFMNLRFSALKPDLNVQEWVGFHNFFGSCCGLPLSDGKEAHGRDCSHCKYKRTTVSGQTLRSGN